MNTLRRLALLVTVIATTVLFLGTVPPLPSHKKLAYAAPVTDTTLRITPIDSVITIVKPKLPDPKPTKRIIPPLQGDLSDFMNKLAKIESNNNPRVVNKYGMMGKYQFSPRTLRLMGMKVSREEFLSNEDLQDSALIMYMQENRRILRNTITRYENTYYRGIYVTRSGILASAHLAGHGGVWAFFDPKKYAYKTTDANGTTVALYMKKFANYKLEF